MAVRITWFKASPVQTQEIVFFHTQLGNYASCLVIGLFFNAIAGILGLQWLIQHRVTDGMHKHFFYHISDNVLTYLSQGWFAGFKVCTQTNAVTRSYFHCHTVLFMQMGNFSTGYFTVAIAVHTFNSLVMQMRQSAIICRSTIAIGWLSTILIGK